ncbi:hypothetical protein [Guillardia theta]|uniref:TPM domain-containing protein n=1 Tax=Guillardia theta TaxID=55529 RepID=Q9AW57_GUITH|nr:hypothetical protein GTHECHR2149 [Guillardia theta]CAC27013.1 hypothetical protein [Guillardia theta]|mmetsp:Transcript_17287/g.57192  ORF Transcript_17287/g.57192 Transcript_17287/m.57192 type:complete len:250 (+) Transcript_17287:4740-5489(+)
MLGFINLTSINYNLKEKCSINLKNFQKAIKTPIDSNIKNLIIQSGLFSILIFNNSGVFASENIQNYKTVNDESGVLTKSSIVYLEKSSEKLQADFGFKLHFLSIRSLPYDVDISKYSKDIFNEMNLGNKDVLIVLSSKLASGSIVWGDDVSLLNSQISESIIKDTYAVKAREEQYSSATIDVTNRLISLLSNKGDIMPIERLNQSSQSNFKSAKATEEKRSKYAAIIIILLVIAFVVPMVQFFYYVKDE